MDFKNFTKNYIKELNNLLLNLDLDEFDKFYGLIKNCKNKIYIIGNGGSAATASHMANDLSIGLKRKDKLTLHAISLADNIAINSAISNDIGYENIFYMQLKDILQAEDIVIAISCSGNSPNIIKAVKYAKEVNSTIVGLSGFDGGKLRELSDIKLHVKSNKGDYGLVEDIHLILNHILFSYLQKEK
ncbi:SIS domain-containing protein [Arcobacter roscoffensis]|uniref:SIS domain-containing protein n=1 Tax=Arcobacter roscoffensis TaxID=2961520 RepID=A0ABY5E3Q5_9BACT|nr:SIS domain-containing protein [Arcobacter roscoffensis]UTJ06375.1 SIS domain-containing protein [Arcobacter roscoffensis]